MADDGDQHCRSRRRLTQFQAYGQANGLLTNSPEVGDAVYFSDSAGTIKHVAIVTDVYNNGTIWSVSGDPGGSGSTMGPFADTSHSRYDAAYSSAIGAHSGAVGWNVAGYTRPAGVPSVGGLIAAKYNALGGVPSFLGSPTTDELTTPNSAWGTGQYNHFQGGSIYWTQETGANSVHGLILDEWAAIGWEQRMGFPTTDELTTPDGVGRYNHFQDGSIYWSPNTGAHLVGLGEQRARIPDGG